MVALEGSGIDADDNHLVEPVDVPVPDAQRTAEGRMAGAVLRRSITGAIIGLVVGAVLFAGLAYAFGLDALAVVLGIAGAILGFSLGGFWGGAIRLPVNEEAFDTYTLDPNRSAPVRVEVRARDPEQAALAATVLRDHAGSRIRRHAA